MLDTIVRKISKLSSFNRSSDAACGEQAGQSKLMQRSASSGEIHARSSSRPGSSRKTLANSGKRAAATNSNRSAVDERCVIELLEMASHRPQRPQPPPPAPLGCQCCKGHIFLNESNDLIFQSEHEMMKRMTTSSSSSSRNGSSRVFVPGKSAEEHIYEEIEDDGSPGRNRPRSATARRCPSCHCGRDAKPLIGQAYREEMVNEVVQSSGTYLNSSSSSMRKKSVRFQPVLIANVHAPQAPGPAELPRTPSTSSGEAPRLLVPPLLVGPAVASRTAEHACCCRCKCKCLHYLNDTISTEHGDCSPANSARAVPTPGILKKQTAVECESQAFYSASLPTPPSVSYDDESGLRGGLSSLPRNSNVVGAFGQMNKMHASKKDSSSTSSSSSISCNTYTSNSINSNSSFSSNHSVTFNCMIEDFISQLAVAKEPEEPAMDVASAGGRKDSNNNHPKNSERPSSLLSKKDSLESKSSFDTTASMVSMSPVSAKSFEFESSRPTPGDKLSFRVTNFTMAELKSRQQIINKFTTLHASSRNSYHASRVPTTMSAFLKGSAMILDASSTIQV